jgi:hypothetical protein
MNLGKAALATPLYISFAWTLMVSYQLFTQIAVTTVIAHINMFWPSAGAWASSKMDTLVFIYAFAWVFVLSSVIPSVILGKGRSVLIQFLVCLTLTFVAFLVQDALTTYANKPIDQLFTLAVLFQNPILAGGYLLMPYLLMLTLDIRSRRKQRKDEEIKRIAPTYLEDTSAAEQKTQKEEIPIPKQTG